MGLRSPLVLEGNTLPTASNPCAAALPSLQEALQAEAYLAQQRATPIPAVRSALKDAKHRMGGWGSGFGSAAAVLHALLLGEMPAAGTL